MVLALSPAEGAIVNQPIRLSFAFALDRSLEEFSVPASQDPHRPNEEQSFRLGERRFRTAYRRKENRKAFIGF